jgi:hypothetical protein
MTTKMKIRSRSAVLHPVATTPVWTTEERLPRIEAMAQRINGYVQFMCQRSNLNCSSEATEKAVRAFYEQMVIMERQLGRIQGEFQLQ